MYCGKTISYFENSTTVLSSVFFYEKNKISNIIFKLLFIRDRNTALRVSPSDARLLFQSPWRFSTQRVLFLSSYSNSNRNPRTGNYECAYEVGGSRFIRPFGPTLMNQVRNRLKRKSSRFRSNYSREYN